METNNIYPNSAIESIPISKMKRLLTVILILLSGLLPNYGAPISSPMGEPITMIFDMPISQKGSPRTTHPAVSATYPNQTVAVHVTHYNNRSIATYIEDANGFIVAYTTGFATNRMYETNPRIPVLFRPWHKQRFKKGRNGFTKAATHHVVPTVIIARG